MGQNMCCPYLSSSESRALLVSLPVGIDPAEATVSPARGGRPVRTPHLEALAGSGATFDIHACAAPVCTPARGSWFTGRMPNRSGAWTNDVPLGRNIPTLATTLRGGGYNAFHVGKWHLDGGGYNGLGIPDGDFDEREWYDLTRFYGEVGRDGPNRFGGWVKGLEDESFTFGGRVADNAVRIMREYRDERPMFLAVEFDEPHGPYICPPPYRGSVNAASVLPPATFTHRPEGRPWLHHAIAADLENARSSQEEYPAYYRRYYECNSFVDSLIGRVVDAAREILGDDVVIMYTSDHGDHLGQFGLGAKGPTMYESTTSVPLIVYDSQSEAGRRASAATSGVDILPTILDYAGIERPESPHIAGRSIVPHIRSGESLRREHVVIEYNRFGAGHDAVGEFWPIRAIRNERYKLVVNLFDIDELYDLEADPTEEHNLLPDTPAALVGVRNEMHRELVRFMYRTKDLMRGRGWCERSWNTAREYDVKALFTTGYKDDWGGKAFAEV
jgi:uncharacterized sulfatase